MNCGQAKHLIDDYIDNGLSPHQRTGLESHFASCANCGAELRGRSSLDRSLRQAFGVEVQSRYLPSAASGRIIASVQTGLNRAIWLHRARVTGQVFAGVAALVLVLVGLSSLLAHTPLPSALNPVRLFPVKQLLLSGRRIAEDAPIRERDPADPRPLAADPDQQPLLSLSLIASSIDPAPMHPGDSFTITLLLQNDLPHSLDTARFDLEISGPSGAYRFPLLVRGPFPAHGVSVIVVTPEVLAAQCEERYLISPRDIFDTAGNYRLRFTLFSPGARRE